jgi:hypothetical protein
MSKEEWFSRATFDNIKHSRIIQSQACQQEFLGSQQDGNDKFITTVTSACLSLVDPVIILPY